MTDEPKIEREVRIKRVRTSISVPEDVDEWVRWKARSEGVPISYVYALAVSRWAGSTADMTALGEADDAPEGD